ncbi:MAG: hypothetical protein JRJ12_09720 [Deltaproteobacteria bacterium]|nr:hypothetical protein [Deltaproteobacteria bacterium]MBW2071758.1 hypothetical protein [Deltaproteobacteria bacterium]
MIDPFAVKDCALIAIATGERAQNLRELRDRLETTARACIYYHFWGGLLRPSFDDPEYQNDFAAWAYHGLHDNALAERLALIDPMDFEDLEGLRRELIELIEERLDENQWVPWAKADQQFHFIRSQIVVLDTRIRISEPEKLRELVPQLTVSSVFYHFIDARRRTIYKSDDFSEWLKGFGDRYGPLLEHLRNVDPYFKPLNELRSQLGKIFEEYFAR